MYQLPNLCELAPDWAIQLERRGGPKLLHQVGQFLSSQSHQIYPPSDRVFAALEKCPFHQTRIVILGQDPYHGPGQANGLAFSVNKGQKLPPSLRNIFLELQQDLGKALRTDSDLSDWAQQGVLLLNRVLTVEAGQADSHQGIGWEDFTEAIVQILVEGEEPILFVLWGKKAQSLQNRIQPPHQWIASSHPSPLSAHRGFKGSQPFSTVNRWLVNQGQAPIRWS